MVTSHEGQIRAMILHNSTRVQFLPILFKDFTIQRCEPHLSQQFSSRSHYKQLHKLTWAVNLMLIHVPAQHIGQHSIQSILTPTDQKSWCPIVFLAQKSCVHTKLAKNNNSIKNKQYSGVNPPRKTRGWHLPTRAPKLCGVNFWRMMEFVGRLPWKT